MPGPTLRLTTDDVTRLVDAIDPLDELVAELAGRGSRGHLTPCPVSPGELVVLDDHVVGGRCLLPSSALEVVRTAAMAAFAARALTAPGVVTAAVVGVGPLPFVTLPLIGRHLAGLSHVAICPTGRDLDRPVARTVTDALDRAGIGWSVRSAVAESVFGATLVIATAVTRGWLGVGRLPTSATVINMTGRDLPDSLVDGVDHVFVDDLALVADNAHRYFARVHLHIADGPRSPAERPVGWRTRRVRADLGQLLRGTGPGRTHTDDVLLVELLGTARLDAGLAGTLYRAAREHGIGLDLAD
jgi:ornithine cyclodeaminase/alanine dehydrogenase-like protein (mu-crystallin family)